MRKQCHNIFDSNICDKIMNDNAQSKKDNVDNSKLFDIKISRTSKCQATEFYGNRRDIYKEDDM